MDPNLIPFTCSISFSRLKNLSGPPLELLLEAFHLHLGLLQLAHQQLYRLPGRCGT